MLRPVLLFSVILLFCVAVYFVFDMQNPPQATTNSNLPEEQELYSGLDYLNDIRRGVGLVAFANSKTLQASARNHTFYLKEQKVISHNETNTNSKFFTGATPSQRAINAGHSTGFVVENISSKHLSLDDSIDGLLSAIYHRFGFLNFDFDEIGYFYDKEIYVFNMSNSLISSLCKRGDSVGMEYITEICQEKRRAISKSNFDRATMPKSPGAIIFPNKDLKTLAVFGAEDPDPLPQCQITSAPVSIEFNPNYNVKLTSFKLFKDGNELKDTILLDKDKDPNQKFNKNQFAIFSSLPFEFGSKYTARVEYIQNGVKRAYSWDFSTKTPKYEYFVVKDGDIIEVEADKTYEIFFMPKDCNDIFQTYTYTKPFSANLKIQDSGVHMLRINASGIDGSVIDFKSATHNIKIIIKNSALGMEFRLAVIGVLFIFMLIIFFVFKRIKA